MTAEQMIGSAAQKGDQVPYQGNPPDVRPDAAVSSFQTMTANDSEARNLTTFLQTGQTLAGTLDLNRALARVLETLGRHHGMVRSFVSLLDPETNELRIVASNGLDEAATRRVSYKIGEGITGRVVQSGKPIVVPQVSREPLFLDRLAVRKKASGRQELTFVCVPIVVNRKPLGALGVDIKYAPERDYERATGFRSEERRVGK